MIEWAEIGLTYWIEREGATEYIKFIPSWSDDISKRGFLIWKNQKIDEYSRWVFVDLTFKNTNEDSFFSVWFPATYQISTLQGNEQPVLNPDNFENGIFLEISYDRIQIFKIPLVIITEIDYVPTDNFRLIRFGFYQNKIYIALDEESIDRNNPLSANFEIITLDDDYSDFVKQISLASFSDNQVRRSFSLLPEIKIWTSNQ